MKPHAISVAQLPQFFQWIDTAEISRSNRCGNTERQIAICNIFLNQFFQRFNVHLHGTVDRHFDHCLISHTHKMGTFFHGKVGNFRSIHPELAEIFRQTVLFDIVVQFFIAEPIPRQQQTGQIGLGTAGSEHSVGIFIITVHPAEIADDFNLYFRRHRSLIPGVH